MTRQQRRQQQREASKVNNIYTFKEAELVDRVAKVIEQERAIIKSTVAKSAIDTIMGAVILSLHDEFRMGNKRINKFLDKFNKQYECIEFGAVTLDDINKWCIEKGIDYRTKVKGA